MSEIDYEAEYDARARVPEHPAIFARWAREAATYRDETPCALGLAYGDSPRQAVDIFLPDARPLALFVHGGWWRALDRSLFSHMARGLNAHGIGVAVAGYDLCPQVSIGEIVEQIRRACLFLGQGAHLTVFGHSAGGHLAAAMAATMPNEVAAGYAISGVFDLAPLVAVSMNADWRLDGEGARALSPLHWPRPKGMFDAVVGGSESSEFKRQSRALCDAWGGRYQEIEGANHFTVLDALADPESAMVARLVELAGSV